MIAEDVSSFHFEHNFLGKILRIKWEEHLKDDRILITAIL